VFHYLKEFSHFIQNEILFELNTCMRESKSKHPTEMKREGLCVPGGLIDTRNMESLKRNREQGLWFWSDEMVAYYESPNEVGAGDRGSSESGPYARDAEGVGL
jgi:hypothetical protein